MQTGGEGNRCETGGFEADRGESNHAAKSACRQSTDGLVRRRCTKNISSKFFQAVLFCLAVFSSTAHPLQVQQVWAQDVDNEADVAAEQATAEQATEQRIGYRINVSLPIRDDSADRLCNQLKQLAVQVGEESQRRKTVVLVFEGAASEANEAGANEIVGNDGGEAAQARNGRGSEFEEALRVARCITGDVTRQLKTVAYVNNDLRGHAVLVVLACDELLVAPGSSLGAASIDEAKPDQAIKLVYQSIAASRAIIPEPAVAALADPNESLYRVTLLDGAERFVGDVEATALRTEGKILKEEKISDAGRAAIFSGQQLRQYRWASQTVERPQDLAGQLGLDRLIEPDQVAVEVKAVRMELRGPINSSRVRRFRSNLIAAFDARTANSVFVEIDSPGGDLSSSLELGLEVAEIAEKSGRSIGYVAGEARGDAVLVATGCKPLYMHPQAKLGASGAATINRENVLDLRTAIEELARSSGRPPALLLGLLDPSIEVYRYTQRRTGQVAYFSELDAENDELAKWERGERIELSDGLTAAQAIELGLAEGQADSAVLAATQAGLEEFPPPLSDRRVVHFVEWLGGLPWLGPLLIFVGFTAFSMEMSAPGLGIPGFVSLICFMFFFWMKFLSGTAEWLEVILFVGGALCILVEVLILPGVGVFGIGGLLMVISAILLMSQTFVIPQNPYQFGQTTRALMSVVAACVGVVMGLVALRYLLPGTPLFRHLVMPGPNSEEMLEQEQREYIVRYDTLIGETGTAVTPLRPAGKAMFGDQVVAVVSDGGLLATGDAVKVIEVHGNRIIVEPV